MIKQKNIFLVFSHHLTEEQKQDAQQHLGVTTFIVLPENLQKCWSQVPAEAELDLNKYAKPFADYILSKAQKGDYVLIQGDFGLSFKLVELMKTAQLIPVYATTKRQTLEELRPDGSIEIQRVFRHQAFRAY